MEKKKPIEAGSNEFEMIEFILDDAGVPNSYGINVAKVREVIKVPKITPVPKSHPCVEGFADLRGNIIPIINISRWLGLNSKQTLNKVLITEFNQTYNGFLVNDVTRIYRLTWNEVLQPTEMEADDVKNCINAVVKMEDKMILILDFEKIVGDIFPESFFKEEKNVIDSVNKELKILIAEDSGIILKLIDKALKKAGYKVYTASNGKIALDKLIELKNEAAEKGEPLSNFIDVVITDLEMPVMGGENLIKNMKEDKVLSQLPIIVFSSMGLEENVRKLKALGANEFINKPDVNILGEAIKNVLNLQ